MSETPSSRQDHARPQGEQGMGAYGTKCNYCHIMREAARRYLAAGLSVIPIRPDGTKAPALPEWKTYQQRRPTPDECTDWWDNGEGIAVVGGKVSGNLEILDLDRPGLDAEFLELADANGLGDLVSRLACARTPSNGMHFYYRSVTAIGRSTKMARDKDGKTLIETRGEGGYAVVAPSPAACHPTRKPYQMLTGDLTCLPVLTEWETTALHRLAKVFDAYVAPEAVTAAPSTERKEATPGHGERPGDDFNLQGDAIALLQRHGWTVVSTLSNRITLRRPGKERPGISAVYFCETHCFHNFSSNAAPFEADKTYRPFAVYALLECGGDYSAAASALVDQGFGVRSKGRKFPTSGNMPSEAVPPAPERQTWTVSEWQQRGSQLANWRRELMERRARIDEDYRWAVGEWYACADVPHGERESYGRKLYDKALPTVRNWATTFTAWPDPDQRGNLSISVCAALNSQPQEVRKHYAERSKTERITVKMVQEELGLKQRHKASRDDWKFVADQLGPTMIQLIVREIQRSGAETVCRKIKALLGSVPDADPTATARPGSQTTPVECADIPPADVPAIPQEDAACAYCRSSSINYTPNALPAEDPSPITLIATAEQQQRASQIAAQRKAGHDHCRQRSEDHGSDEANLRYDCYGALAEVVTCDWLEQQGLISPPEYVSSKPVPRPDITLHGQRLDIKSSPPRKGFLCINEGQYLKKQGECDGYLPVLFLTEDTVQIMRPVRYEDVGKWDRMDNGHSPYKSIRRSDLKPLTCRDELACLSDPSEEEWEEGEL